MTRNARLAAVSVAVLILGPSTARAEEPRYGLQVHLSAPTGDLKTAVDNKPGAGLGAHVTFDLGSGHMLRPRFDAVFFPEGAFNGFKTKANDLSLGGDYMFFPSGKPEGFYLTAGIGLHRWSVDTTTPTTSGTQSSSRFGYAAGFGYNFNRSMGGELRYVSTHYANQTAWDPAANSLQAGVTFRF